MNVALLALTIVSLAATAGFGALTWHVLREDRHRSVARVAALAGAIEADTIRPPTASSLVAGGTLFRPSAPSTHGRPVIKAAVIGAMAVTLIVFVAMTSRRGSPVEGQVAVQAADPLELVSMHHVRQGTTLTVSGLVRNPSAGAPAKSLTAEVFAFDHAGGFVASGRAPIDVSVLEPGDESPFAVAVPDVDDVGRYRVSFRTELGVVRHVDRRADETSVTPTLR